MNQDCVLDKPGIERRTEKPQAMASTLQPPMVMVILPVLLIARKLWHHKALFILQDSRPLRPGA